MPDPAGTPVRWYRLVRLLALAAAILGTLMCWPYVRSLIEYDRAPGVIHVIDIHPLDGDRARVSVGFEFTSEGTTWLCWRQGTAFYRPLGEGVDPVMPLAQAREARDRLLSEARPGWRPGVEVLLHANHPAETAFIIGVDEPRPWQRTIIGGLLVMAGTFFLTRRRREA